MKDNIKNNFKELLKSAPEGTFEQIMSVLDLPDEQFDAVYPQFKKEIGKIMQNNDLQREIILTVKDNPISKEDFQEAKELVNSFVEEIKKDDTISENKKDMIITLISKSVESAFDLAENPRERIGVKIQLINEDAKIPEYAHPSDAGADIFAVEETIIPPHKTVIVKTGIKVAIPAGYEIQIRPRSGLSLKTLLRIANAPGTIDANYRGEVGVIITNTGNLTQTIAKHDKIAQMVIAPVPMITWETVDNLDETDRGSNGFGSTDKS